MERRFQQHVQTNHFWSAGQRVLVAVSTGADSMVLLTLLQRLPLNLRPKIGVVHVNHQLRQQSEQEEVFLTDYCQRQQLPLFKTHWVDHPLTGVEQAARQFRYRFFADIMQQHHYSVLLTAHHGDDELETILMNLVRGGDIQTMTGIRSQRTFASGKLMRPLLVFSKQELRDYADRQQIKYFDDVTNNDLTFMRNQIRHQIVPVLKQDNRQVLAHAVAFSERLQRLLRVTQQFTDEQLQRIGQFSVVGFQGKVSAFKSFSTDQQVLLLDRIVERCLIQRGVTVNEGQKQQLLRAISSVTNPQTQIDLANSWQFERSYDLFGLRLRQTAKVPESAVYQLSVGQWQQVDRQQLGLVTEQAALKPGDDVLSVYLAPTELPLIVRHRQPGDQLAIKTGHQSVKRLLINEKVPSEKRERLWFVTTAQNKGLWLLNLKKSQLFNQIQTDKIHYRLVLRNI
ncbi:tRNA lysidine(34) synthetase TilS [Loigolactobacillus iwatensis]|uniref:tRNA lysidine(34) synthetase TilS n=1 Tax=Loigolactobacillus iwatensis TaxID=1267156 RepID=UPI001CDC8A60|nr:tRNA lysidine(34) synthetase TilS [Loigolactobacillus iwatensis]